MSAEYDSEKLHSLAKQTENAGDLAAAVANDSFQRVMKEIPDNFKGEAADALFQSVSELRKDAVKLSEKIYNIEAALNQLAKQLETADQQAKNIVISK